MLQSLSMLLQWPGLNLFTDSQKQPSQPINIFYTLSVHCQGKNRLRQRALDYSNTKAWWMSFAFCMCLFLFLSFCIWNPAFLSRICKFRRRMAVWLPEKLLSFTVASVLNWARRFECYNVLFGQILTFVQWRKEMLAVWRAQLDALVEIEVFVLLCSVVDCLNNLVSSVNSHLLSSSLSALLLLSYFKSHQTSCSLNNTC